MNFCKVCGAMTSNPDGICSFCKSKQEKITQIGIKPVTNMRPSWMDRRLKTQAEQREEMLQRRQHSNSIT